MVEWGSPVFADRLAEAVAGKRSQLVVGLDPRVELLPPEFRGDAYTTKDLPRVPGNLTEAIDALEKSQVARQAFGDVRTEVRREADSADP